MKLIRYCPHTHYTELMYILDARSAYVPHRDEMPEIGYVAFAGTTPVSFAFLRRVEGRAGIVDGFASNPECSPALRHEGNDLVIKACIEEAIKLKLKTLIAFTSDSSTKERSARHGFVELQQYTCLSYDFNRKVD